MKMNLIMLIISLTLAVIGFVFYIVHHIKSSDLSGYHWSRVPAIICLGLAFAITIFSSIMPFPDDTICPSCNKEIHTTYCMDCGSKGVFRRDLIQACPSCGERIGENEKFCGDCGAEIN